MKGPIAKCGMDCGSCGSYHANLRTMADRRRVSAAWEKYLGSKLDPGKLRRCVGCQAPGRQRYINCVVRRCALRSGMKTCVHCGAYPCDELNQRVPDEGWVKRIRSRVGAIPKQDYEVYIAPYLGLRNLARVRRKLRRKDIKEPLPFRVSPRLVEFPTGIPVRRREALRRVYRLISAIKTLPADTWAKHLAMTGYRRDMLRMLWTFGRHGRLCAGARPYLEVDAETYCRAGNFSMKARIEQVCIPLMGRLGAKVKLVVIDTDAWLTPRGALRRQGWIMRLSLTTNAGGPAGLKALQRWCATLQSKYHGRAFTRFSTADMRALG